MLHTPCLLASTVVIIVVHIFVPFAACALSQRLARLQLRPACGVQTAEIAAAKAAHKVQEGAAAAYEVTKQKAGEAYASTAEYLKEKVLPANSQLSLGLRKHGSVHGPASVAVAVTCVPAAAIHSRQALSNFTRFATNFGFFGVPLVTLRTSVLLRYMWNVCVFSLIKPVHMS